MLPPSPDECFANVPHEFLICTTIHKARQLGIFTGQTFVRISLDKAHKTTKTFSNSENPYFNEYFVFELRCTLTELLRMTILYEVKKQPSCKKSATHGELLIDLQSVWNQPNRCYFKKWGRLECPIGSKLPDGAPKGFLQIDLAIVSQATNTNALMRPYEGEILGMNKWQLNEDYEDIEKNLLQNLDPTMQCNIRYLVTFYRGIFVKKGDYVVQFRFTPFKGKTNVKKSTTQPEWNEEVSFAWTFPSLAQTFLIQVLYHEHLQWKTIAEYELHFDEIAFKDKPSLGPAFLHLYDIFNPSVYVGRLLIEVRSERLESDPRRELVTNSVAAIEDKRWWQEETFLIEFMAMQGDFLHGNTSNCKLSLKFAEHTSNHLECYLKAYGAKQKRLSHLKHFKQDMPYKAITIKTTQPDTRHKFESDFFMQELLDYMKTEIETFKLFQLKYNNHFQIQTKCFKAIILSIQNKIREGLSHKRMEYSGFQDPTPWDTNRLVYLQEFFRKFPDELRHLRQKLKSAHAHHIESAIEEVLQDLIHCSTELANLLASTRVQDEWPDLLVMLSVSGSKDIAVCRLNAKYYLNPPKDKEASPNGFCWRVRNFVFKDIHCQHSCMHCGCTVAIVNGCLGIVVENERTDFLNNIAHDWKQTESFYWTPSIPFTVFKCRLFIHQAKVRPGSDRTGLCDAFVRIIFGAQSAETPTESATLSPIWNLVICFEGIVMPGGIQWYIRNPPLVAVELYDVDKHTHDDYLGCGLLAVSVISNDKEDASIEPDSSRFGDFVKTRNAFQKFQLLKTMSPPLLKWVPIACNGSVRAEVLMSAEMVEMQHEDSADINFEPTLTVGIPNGIRPNMRNFVLEVVFAGFRNYTKSAIASKHRIKVMMGDLLLMSGLSTTRIKNSINFLMLYASGVVSLPEQLEYWPAIIVTDVTVSSRGTETTVGAALIPNSKRFLQRNLTMKCTPRVQFDHASSPESIALHIDDAETSPLLSKQHHMNMIMRFWGGLRAKKVRRHTPRSSLPHGYDASNIMDENEFTWWTKFYNSLYVDTSRHSSIFKHSLTVYANELEKQSEFSYLHDWAEPVKLVHGVKYKKNALPKEEVYTTLKLQIKLTQCHCGAGDCGDGAMLRPLAAALNPKYQAQVQTLADLCKIVARVYVVQGIQFRPHDKHNQSDSYVKLHLGTKTASNRAHYVPNQSNPIFGKCFQLEGSLPKDHMLEITVFDRNALRDEIIGTTVIDLEDRWRSRHRATVGLPHEYSKFGYNRWRDLATPYEILMDLCTEHDIKEPIFKSRTIEVDGVVFRDETRISRDEELQERLSLTVLRNFEKLPSFGYRLVPEHVETRSLYRSDCPGIEQGKLQLWVELYEGNLNIPPPIDITPQPPNIYELRVIVHNCADLVMDEKNIFGKHMSDLFVKGWCSDMEQTQTTDIHYRSLNGEGNFNWRMIFPLKYSSVDDMMLIKRKGGFFDEYETKQPPMLYIQVWDNDLISSDDFLGSLEVNLSNLPEPFESQKSCTLPGNKFNPFPFGGAAPRKPMNLFRQKNVKGWFPLRGHRKMHASSSTKFDDAMGNMTGKIELELEIVSDAEAVSQPVGLGRNPPNALPVPIRPDTSFNPFLNPFKSIKQIIFPAFRKYLIYIGVGAFLLLLVVSLFTKLPMILMGLG